MQIRNMLGLPALALATVLTIGCGTSTEPEVLNQGGVSEEDRAEMEAYEQEMETYQDEYEEDN